MSKKPNKLTERKTTFVNFLLFVFTKHPIHILLKFEMPITHTFLFLAVLYQSVNLKTISG